MVAISVLILRYIPPNKVPLPPSLKDSIAIVSKQYDRKNAKNTSSKYENTNAASTSEDKTPLILKDDVAIDRSSFAQYFSFKRYVNKDNRRRVAGRMIALSCLGAFVVTYATSSLSLVSFVRFTLCGVGGIILLSSLALLSILEQDDASQNFGHSGGFVCPFVPLLPIASILINSYLLVNLSMATWLRVSVWLAGGVLVYGCYGRTHSCLKDVIYVPAIQVDEIYRASQKTYPV